MGGENVVGVEVLQGAESVCELWVHLVQLRLVKGKFERKAS